MWETQTGTKYFRKVRKSQRIKPFPSVWTLTVRLLGPSIWGSGFYVPESTRPSQTPVEVTIRNKGKERSRGSMVVDATWVVTPCTTFLRHGVTWQCLSGSRSRVHGSRRTCGGRHVRVGDGGSDHPHTLRTSSGRVAVTVCTRLGVTDNVVLAGGRQEGPTDIFDTGRIF